MKEQERLQDKCNRLETMLRRIKGIIGDEFNSVAVGAVLDGQIGLEQDKQDATESSAFFQASESREGPDSCHNTDEPDSLGHEDILGSSMETGDHHLSAPTFLSHELDFFDLTGAYSHGARETGFAATGPSLGVDEDGMQNEGDQMDDISAAVHSSSFDLVPVSLGRRSAIGSMGLNASGFIVPMDDDGPLHLSLPLQSSPTGAGQGHTMLATMLEEARQQNQCEKFDRSPPSLKRLLSDPPPDILSFRLFHYITMYGAMPLHLLLSIFWVQYLFLRVGSFCLVFCCPCPAPCRTRLTRDLPPQWRVLTTVEDFLRVPEFLRPTGLERRVPHQLSINMLVWYGISSAQHKVETAFRRSHNCAHQAGYTPRAHTRQREA